MKTKKKYLSKDDLQNILKEFVIDGLSYKELAIKYEKDVSTIGRIIRKNNIVIRNKKPKYQPNIELLNSEINEFLAYFLGFMYADGSVTKNKSYIKLHKEDKYMLELFSSKLFINNRPLYNAYDSENSVILPLHNQLFSSFLIKNGCVSNKTQCLKFPFETIPEHLQRHFIRGFFDGDGCITGIKNKGEFSIGNASEQIIKDIKNIFNNLFPNIYVGITTQFFNIPFYSIRITKVAYLQEIYNYLYNDANIYLTRKFNKFKIIINALS